MSTAAVLFCVLYLGILVCSVLGGEYCTIDDGLSTRTSFCEHGCCGTAAEDNRDCCEDGSSNVYFYVGGGVGGSAGLFIVCLCCYFCLKK